MKINKLIGKYQEALREAVIHEPDNRYYITKLEAKIEVLEELKEIKG